jgi:DNA-directed RNA polymerase subunit RPC12/RpoP
MKCSDCNVDIIAKDVSMCSYCGSKNVVSDEEDQKLETEATLKKIENYKRAGKYEDAALLCEELEMWDEAGEIRRNARTNYVISANVNIAKVESISMECPHCGASQPNNIKGK